MVTGCFLGFCFSLCGLCWCLVLCVGVICESILFIDLIVAYCWVAHFVFIYDGVLLGLWFGDLVWFTVGLVIIWSWCFCI